MSVFSSSALQRVYIGPQTVLRTIPNASGAWTTTGVKWAPHVSIDMPTATELVTPQFKTGTGSNLRGIPGRQGGAPVRGNFTVFAPGTAGTKPDLDVMLQSIFANPATVSAGVSVTYAPAFSTNPFVMAVYNRSASGSTNRFSWGNVPTRATFNLGGAGLFSIDYEGIAGYTFSSDSFAGESAIGKAGLTSFPAEPTPSAVGNVILPYNGSATFGGVATIEFVSAQLEVVTGAGSRNDGYADAFTFATFAGKRTITLKGLKFADSDSAALAAIKAATSSKAPMDIDLVNNSSGAGYILTHHLKGVQFGNAHWNDAGNSVDFDVDDSPASASSYTAIDEYSQVWT